MTTETSSFTRYSIRTFIGSTLVLCCAFTVCVAVSLQYFLARDKALQSTVSDFQTLSSSVSDYLVELQRSAEQATISGTRFVSLLNTAEPQEPLLFAFAQLLNQESRLHSIYVAQANNRFFQLIQLHSQEIREKVNARTNERWMLVLHDGQELTRQKQVYYLDQDLNRLRSESEYSNFVATRRSWYENAREDKVYNSSPYLFHTLKLTGETYSMKVPGKPVVVGVDVLLSSLEEQLRDRFVDGQGGGVVEGYIYQNDGRLIASNRNINVSDELPLVESVSLSPQQQQLVESMPELKVSNQNDWAPLDFEVGGKPYGMAVDLFKLVSEMTGLKFRFINGRSWEQLVSDFESGDIAILQSVASDGELANRGYAQGRLFEGAFALLVMASNTQITSLDNIRNSKLALIKGWSIIDDLKVQYPALEIYEYSSLHGAIDALRSGDVDAIMDLESVLNVKVSERFGQDLRIVPIGQNKLSGKFSYFVHSKYTQIQPIIELALNTLSDEQYQFVANKWNDQSQSNVSYVPYLELVEYTEAQKTNQMHLLPIAGKSQYLFVAQLTENNPEYLAITIPEQAVLASANRDAFFVALITALVLLPLIVLAWWLARPISTPIRRATENVARIAERDFSALSSDSSRIKEVHDLDVATIALAKALQDYDAQQKQFFESMIQLVAESIDEKSHYTGGHCNRVPEIALQLADEAEQSQSGAFASFEFANEDERREFRVAAWLHDCGKITTPEYVVDKATKLETNYNRIHELRTRFEVLWRDAQIDYLLQQLPQQPSLEHELKSQLQELRDQFAFIARSNQGGESLSKQDKQRLQQLAQVKWQRFFDDQLGLSNEESARVEKSSNLPVQESLIMDKAEHRITRPRPFSLDPSFGINMEIPELLYNRGELYNLLIERGTLSNEERFKINEHMISGIKMLARIPFPPEMAQVPRYATTHHEKINGEGYPRGLSGDELSIPEKLLAIADVFEALTATDRPYKQGKSLSETLTIMGKMVDGKHLDRDSYNLLLKSGVYLDYANKYMPKRLVDNVDITSLLR